MVRGPLCGVKIIEFGGIGPGPLCGMLLSDLGADVIRIDRKAAGPADPYDVITRGRRSIALDLKDPAAIDICLDLIKVADALFEPFRPGVMERVGVGPDVALKLNPRLVYGRMTGWGQDGPLATTAGHDLNYISLVGALHAIGTREKPIAPLNLVGDNGGGALYLAFGILAGIIHAQQTGEGQVIDCAMIDGAASLMAQFIGLAAGGKWVDARRSNIGDGAAHFYDTYQCADGKWVSIASIEPRFYALLLEKAELTDPDFQNQWDKTSWPRLQEKLAKVIASKTQSEWCLIMGGTDVCFAPVLGLLDAPKHPHNQARGTFIEHNGVVQPAPAPRFSKTPGAIQGPPPAAGEHNLEILADWGFTPHAVEALVSSGVIDG